MSRVLGQIVKAVVGELASSGVKNFSSSKESDGLVADILNQVTGAGGSKGQGGGGKGQGGGGKGQGGGGKGQGGGGKGSGCRMN
jgi:hypothetical protein